MVLRHQQLAVEASVATVDKLVVTSASGSTAAVAPAFAVYTLVASAAGVNTVAASASGLPALETFATAMVGKVRKSFAILADCSRMVAQGSIAGDLGIEKIVVRS